MAKSNNLITWSFDLGKASLGEAVRKGDKFLHVQSLLVPEDFAETKTAAGRRRMHRTRLAHQAREAWLRKVFLDAGLETLRGKQISRGKKRGEWIVVPGDQRLEKEFPSRDEGETCYTSCLLRIKLLQGEKLEQWQVFKALHSAIQRRGYDPAIPWKTKDRSRSKADQEKEAGVTLTRMNAFTTDLEKMIPNQPKYHLPCYYDAWKMGLWSPDQPEKHLLRITYAAQSTRERIIPRTLVEKELTLLTEAAGKLYPALAGKAAFLIHGPTGTQYASYYPALRKQFGLREGGENDWQGALGQKLPRFDNRIIAKCALIPRFNVCKILADDKGKFHPSSLLSAEVTFLMKLKNMRFWRNGVSDQMTPAELRSTFEDPAFATYKITATAWKKYCTVKLRGLPRPGFEEVEAPRTSGRSSFCRPALALVRELILSGLPPVEFHKAKLAEISQNQNPSKGLVARDLDFIPKMGNSWQELYLPNQKLEALAALSAIPEKAIQTLIGSQNDPIVRHRLGLFYSRVLELEKAHGKPDQIVLEFVREDFMGTKAKIELKQFQNQRAKERLQNREDAKESGQTGKAAGLKMELLKAQAGICLYTGESLALTKLDEYHIDHIVPRTSGGPDSVMNYVLTTSASNDAKSNQTPYKWLSGSSGWDAYVERVKSRTTALRNKKVQLLTSPDAAELIQKYTALAETAWISKLAQTILSLHLGWQNGIKAGTRKITIVNGGLTARIRRMYKLNSLLHPDSANEEEAEKKNRDDDRHHALDAMVISYVPEWSQNPTSAEQGFFRFPEGIDKDFFKSYIASVVPKNVCLEKSALEQTIYGKRQIEGHTYLVGRILLVDLAVKQVKNRPVLKPVKDIEVHRVTDARIRADLVNFLAQNPSLTLEEWVNWCSRYRIGPNGAKVGHISTTKTKPDNVEEYKDLSKDKTGQFRKGAKHRGYFVYERPSPTKKDPLYKQVEVKPVYVFESMDTVARALEAEHPGIRPLYFESGCGVRTLRAWDFQGRTYPSSEYVCSSIWANRNAKLRHPAFGEIGPVGLRILLDAGLERST